MSAERKSVYSHLKVRRSKVKKSIVGLIVLCGLLLSGCAKSSKQMTYTGPPLNDIEYAKKVFQLLGDGDESVKSMIDWEHLKMMGIDIGTMYTNTSGEDARDKNLSDFIRGYSTSFKRSGGKFENLSNWREQSRDATNTVVAADSQMG
jgi:PBP1b-binding outer membrane lipoprotein LpoB